MSSYRCNSRAARAAGLRKHRGQHLPLDPAHAPQAPLSCPRLVFQPLRPTSPELLNLISEIGTMRSKSRRHPGIAANRYSGVASVLAVTHKSRPYRPSLRPLSVESRMGAVAWAMRQRSVSHPRSSNEQWARDAALRRAACVALATTHAPFTALVDGIKLPAVIIPGARN
jgi:hypothetical protein